MKDDEKNVPARAARALLQGAHKAALGTIGAKGFPLVTLVAFGTLVDGTPILLLSRLAAHTQNVMRDDKVSLLIEGETQADDPLLTARLSLVGRLRPVAPDLHAIAKRHFTSRHPGSVHYDTELDFSYFRLAIDQARFNQGFGAFTRLQATDLIID